MTKQFLLTARILLVCGAAVGQTDSLPAATFHWRCGSGQFESEVPLNHNPALRLAGGESISFDSLPYARDYTMIVVYRPSAAHEADVWKMTYGDSDTRGLTSERIVSDSTTIRYADQTGERPVISTLRLSAPDSTGPYARLTVGGGQGLNVAEVLYYDSRLGTATLRKVQTKLAVRYGITLGPMDYIDVAGTSVWNYADSGLYHHRVTGVAADSLARLRQPRSRSEEEGAMLTVIADSLGQGEYLLVGDNDAPSAFVTEQNIEILQRRWKAQSRIGEGKTVTLMFDVRNLGVQADSLVLITDNQLYFPSSVDGESVAFEGVSFDSDSSFFTLAHGDVFGQMAKSAGPKGAKGHQSEEEDTDAMSPVNSFDTRLYPNPTTGRYTLEIDGARQVQVEIYSLQGRLVASYSGHDRERYTFEGTLPSGNIYYATVTTEDGSRTLKLVVK